MSQFYDQASLVMVPSGYKSGKIYSQKPLSTDGELSFSRASTATRVNASGLIESVASGVPRLDYSGGASCPSLLLEPQRTNLALWSEQMDNAAWVKNNATITANSVVSPDGYTNADTYTATGGGNYISGGATSTGSNTITYSVFAKAGTQNIFRIREAFYFGSSTIFDLSTGTVTSGTGTITSYANGWYRCTHTQSYGLVQTNVSVIFDTTASSGTFYLYGAQFEAGAYATSYIPTLSSAVTRLQDSAENTSASSIIGQTEGTMFVQVGDFPKEFNGRIIAITQDSNNYITILKNGNYKDFYTLCAVGGASQMSYQGTGSLSDNAKIAVAYANNDFVIYVNGTQVHTDTSGSVPTCSNLFIGKRENNSLTYSTGGSVSQALLFKTRLSNADLATLTTL